jgi:DNA-binding CsgD family transcriptional regulator/PAS domain-containing protein
MEVLSQEKVLGLIGRIYDAAADARLWPAFLQDFADAASGTLTAIHFYDRSAPVASFGVFVNLDPAHARQYAQHYHSVDPWIEEWKKRWNRAGAETIEAGDQVVELAKLEKTEFYNDWLSKQNLAHQIGCMLTKTNQRFSAFTCNRPRKAGPFGTAELALLRALFPHLERALMFHRRIAELEGRYHASLDALDCLTTGVVLLDDQGRILTTNREADRLLRQKDGLCASRYTISAANQQDTQQLHGMIAGAAKMARGEGIAAGGFLALPRPSGKRPLSVLVAPLGRHAFAPGIRTPAVVVFVTDPERMPESPPDALSRLYELTAAESRLAELLMQGETVVRAAERLSISHNTARTHLQRIYQKTGTTHQSALVRVLLSSALPWPAGN